VELVVAGAEYEHTQQICGLISTNGSECGAASVSLIANSN
jgi:hypothetical protein